MSEDARTATPDERAVWSALRSVVDPCSIATGVPIDIVDMGLVRDVTVTDEGVRVNLWVTSPTCTQMPLIRGRIEAEVLDSIGRHDVTCHVDPRGNWLPSEMASDARDRLARRIPIIAT